MLRAAALAAAAALLLRAAAAAAPPQWQHYPPLRTPPLIWPDAAAQHNASSADGGGAATWLLVLRDRSHAVALCAEAEGRLRGGALRRFAGACARPASRARSGGGGGGRLAPLGVVRFAPAQGDVAHVAAAAAALGPSRLEFAERDGRVSAAAAANVPTGAQRTGRDLHALDRLDQASLPLDGMYAPPFWPSAQRQLNGSGVHVYILDTGIRRSHAELSGRVGPGADFVTSSGDASDAVDAGDPNGHGTHVAACVAGGRFGVAKGATVHSVRVLDAAGDATWSRVLKGLDWVAEHGRRPAVVVLALAGGRSLAAERAAAALAAAGVLPVAAAGNAGGDACAASPAGGGAALVVGAATAVDSRAGFSNSGPCVDLFAPGEDVLSAWALSDTATHVASGTSAAAPLAAAAAALFLEAAPDAPPAAVKAAVAAAAAPGRLAAATLGAGSPNRLLNVAGLGAAADAHLAAMAAGADGGVADVALTSAQSSVTSAVRAGALACAAAAVAPWGAWGVCDVACGWGTQRRGRAQTSSVALQLAAACPAAPAMQSRTCYAGACDESAR